MCKVPVLDLVSLSCLLQSKVKIFLKEVVKVVNVVCKSCCYIQVLAVMMTIQQKFLMVTIAVATINDRSPAIILSTVVIDLIV